MMMSMDYFANHRKLFEVCVGLANSKSWLLLFALIDRLYCDFGMIHWCYG